MKRQKDETLIALMANNIAYIQNDIKEIKATLKELSGTYVTVIDFNEHIKTDDDHEIRIRSIEQNMWKWIGIAIAGSIAISFIVELYLKSH